MKNAASYISSFVLSVLLVFSLIASLGVTVVSSFANPENIMSLAEQKNIGSVVYSELEKYFRSKQNDSGIPAEVYMDAMDEAFVYDVMRNEIENGFRNLEGGQEQVVADFSGIEKSLSNFYSDYAESIGYEKDAKYDEKLSGAQSNARKIITDYCDVFKLGAMNTHGILRKVSPIYSRLSVIRLAVYGAAILLMLFLPLLNFKSMSATLYWIGVSSLISGIIGAVPCIYLKATDYFSAFTIKQAQIYAAYTGMMNAATDKLLFATIFATAVGALLIVGYALLVKNKK